MKHVSRFVLILVLALTVAWGSVMAAPVPQQTAGFTLTPTPVNPDTDADSSVIGSGAAAGVPELLSTYSKTYAYTRRENTVIQWKHTATFTYTWTAGLVKCDSLTHSMTLYITPKWQVTQYYKAGCSGTFAPAQEAASLIKLNRFGVNWGYSRLSCHVEGGYPGTFNCVWLRIAP